MSSVRLASSQKTILITLISLYRNPEDAVEDEDIVAEANRDPGIIRSQTQSLKVFQLVKGVPGLRGGYEPTADAYGALDVDKMDEPMFVPLFHNDEGAEGVNVDEVDLSNVHHPKLCRAEVHVQGLVRELHEDDKIRVGPTPFSKFVIDGTLDGKGDMSNILTLRIDDMQAPVGKPRY